MSLTFATLCVVVAGCAVAGCGEEDPVVSVVVLRSKLNASIDVRVLLAPEGMAHIYWYDKTGAGWTRLYWGVWRRRGAGYLLVLDELQEVRRVTDWPEATRVKRLVSPLSVELVARADVFKAACPEDSSLHDLSVTVDRRVRYSESRLRCDFLPLRPGIQEEEYSPDGE